MALPSVTVVLPKMVAEAVGEGRIRVRAATLRAALEEAYRLHPALRHHLCEDSGAFRTHVLCFHNAVNTRDVVTLDRTLREGDEIRFLQAISGG